MSQATGTRGTMVIPEADHTIQPTAFDEIDDAVATVRAAKDAWVAQDITTRLVLLEELMASTRAVAERWVRTACAARKIDFDSPTSSNEWQGVAITMSNLRSLHETLTEITHDGRPTLPGEPHELRNGQVAVPAFPRDAFDRAMFDRITAEVRLLPDVTLDNIDENIASTYRAPGTREGKVALVLGAGNVSAIPATDAFYKLFVDDEVVVLKMNPVNEYLGPIFEEAFAPLVEHGFLRIVYGGADEGAYLTGHDDVDTIHITGSDKTHDAIVFGTGEEGARNKAEGRPQLTKPITSELGNVSPVIVVPGPWTPSEIAYHGRNIASMLTNNAGFNCIAARAIVTHRDWSSRRDLLDAVREVFAQTDARFAYYPGAQERWERFVEAHPEAERYAASHSAGCLPWTLIPELEADADDDIAFNTEAFASVVGEVVLDAPRDVPAFLEQAVAFCNDTLWGTLGASIIVHPRQMKDPEIAAAVERAIDDLRYGSITVNHWMGLPYGIMTTTWGAYPGHTLTDIQSGIGVVHNTLMLEQVEKSVVRGPFRTVVDPPWFTTHPYAHRAYEAAVAHYHEHTAASFARLVGYLFRDGQRPSLDALAGQPAYLAHQLRRSP